MIRWTLAISMAMLACAGSSVAQENAGSPVVATLLRIPAKTFGGDQFWADEFIRGGWRIQRNAFSGHYRLLDPGDFRRAIGDYEVCRARFDELTRDEPLSPARPKAVVLLHGLVRSRDCMVPLADYLAEKGGYEVVNVSYPSSRGDVDEHAASLAKVLDNLEGVEEVNFVGHSLGNLVVRRWMHDHCREGAEPKFKLGRFVMLGPPNNGAQLARTFKDYRLFRLVAGPSGKQLGPGWEGLTDHLCVPPCEFGILAGAAAIPNPLVSGADDLLVSVEETKLAGAADFRVLPVHHGGIRNGDVVGELTLNFLQHGYFTKEDERVPIQK